MNIVEHINIVLINIIYRDLDLSTLHQAINVNSNSTKLRPYLGDNTSEAS